MNERQVVLQDFRKQTQAFRDFHNLPKKKKKKEIGILYQQTKVLGAFENNQNVRFPDQKPQSI